MPSPQQVRHDPLLTDFAVGYIQEAEGFVANKVAPLVNVSRQTGKYRVFSKADFLRDEYALRAPGAPAVSADYGASLAEFIAHSYALKHALPDEVREEYDAEGPATADRAASEFLAQKALIRRERLMVASLVAGSTWTAMADQTGVGSGPSTNEFLQFVTSAGVEVSSSNPIQVLSVACEAVRASIGRMANRILMPGNVWSAIRRHSVVRALLSNDSLRVPSTADVEALLGIPAGSIQVSQAIYNTAAEGVAVSTAYAMGKSILVLYVDDSAGISSPTAAKQFSWTPFDDVKDAKSTGAPGIRKWRDPDESARTDWYGGEISTVFKVTAADAGCYLASVIG